MLTAHIYLSMSMFYIPNHQSKQTQIKNRRRSELLLLFHHSCVETFCGISYSDTGLYSWLEIFRTPFDWATCHWKQINGVHQAKWRPNSSKTSGWCYLL